MRARAAWRLGFPPSSQVKRTVRAGTDAAVAKQGEMEIELRLGPNPLRLPPPYKCGA